MKDQDQTHAMMMDLGARARAASAVLASSPASVRAEALTEAANAVWADRAEIIKANTEDMAFGHEKGLSPAMMDRLMLDEDRIKGIVSGLRAVSAPA